MENIRQFPNVYFQQKGRNKVYYTKSIDNNSFFEEYIKRQDGSAFREVDPTRSKLFASIAKGISQLGIKEGCKLLYLGASHGYTVSFVSDMVGKDGEIYALDFAPRVVRDLVFIAETRKNMAPIMADANQPDTYKEHVPKVDVIFMDVAQRNQVEIFLKNCDQFLEEGGVGLLALKARSVDVTRKPKDIFKEARSKLEKHLIVNDYKELEPYEKDHAFFVCKKATPEQLKTVNDQNQAQTRKGPAVPFQHRSRDSNRSGGYSRDGNRDSNRSGGYSRDGSRDSNRSGGYNRDGSRDSNRSGRYSRDGSRDSNRSGRYSRDGSRDSNRSGGYSRDSNSRDNNSGSSRDAPRKGRFTKQEPYRGR